MYKLNDLNILKRKNSIKRILDKTLIKRFITCLLTFDEAERFVLCMRFYFLFVS